MNKQIVLKKLLMEKVILITALFMTSAFGTVAESATSLPDDYYNPIDTVVPASHIKCVGQFYEHNFRDDPYETSLDQGKELLILFDENGDSNFTIKGKALRVTVYSAQTVWNNSGGNILNVAGIEITISTSIKSAATTATEYIDLLNNDGVATQQIDGTDHLYISCYPILIN